MNPVTARSHAGVPPQHWIVLKMVRQRALFLIMCMALVAQRSTAQGQECGENPMRQVLMVAKRTGRSIGHVLDLLKDIDSPAYESLANRFRTYAACVGLVDTGYFRKRGSPYGGIETLKEMSRELQQPHASDFTRPTMISSLNAALEHLRRIYKQLESTPRQDGDQKRESMAGGQAWSHVPSLWLNEMKRAAMPDKEVADQDAWDQEDQYR